LAAYADKAAVESDSPTLLPVGYLFKADWSNHLTFIKLLDRRALLKLLQEHEAPERPQENAARKKAGARKAEAKNPAHPSGKVKKDEIPPLAGIPTGT